MALPSVLCFQPCHPFAPALQLKHVKRLGKQFSFGRQEDSHELYLRLMEAIEAVQVRPRGLLLRLGGGCDRV